MSYRQRAYAGRPQIDERRAPAAGALAVLEHREENVETLFGERLAQIYGSASSVSAAGAASFSAVGAASSRRLREMWRRCETAVAFERFAQDAFAALQHAYDRKYGEWEQVNDLRTLYPGGWQTPILPYTAALRPGARALGVGVNDGREVRRLFEDRGAQLDLIDISARAIGKLAHRLNDYRHARGFVATFEDWEPVHRGYDLFFALRTLNCTAVDRGEFVRKSVELVKPGGTLLYSVSNGYVHMEHGVPKAVHGMFSYATGAIDPERPREIAAEIRDRARFAGASVIETIECPTEIFLVAAKERSPRAGGDGLR